MDDRIPLAEASGDEIIARVVYQVIKLDYAKNPETYDNPTEALLMLANIYRFSNLDPVAEQLTLCAIWVGNGGTVATWLRARIFIPQGRVNRLMRAGRGPRR